MPVAISCQNPECYKTFLVKPSKVKIKKCCSMSCYSQMRKLITEEKYIGNKHGKLTILILKGNGLEPGNAVVLCKSCNSSKHDHSLDELPTDWQITIEQAATMFATSIESK